MRYVFLLHKTLLLSVKHEMGCYTYDVLQCIGVLKKPNVDYTLTRAQLEAIGNAGPTFILTYIFKLTKVLINYTYVSLLKYCNSKASANIIDNY